MAIPDLDIHLDSRAFLCDVAVADTLADTNLADFTQGPGCLAKRKAKEKEGKYRDVARGIGAVHLPFAIETFYIEGSLNVELRGSHTKHDSETHLPTT